ncbi:carboxylesterase 1 [Cajanus cajan]|uniref:Gibberellin receptor GID1 n=1 Tax=Cajanus cajan TaxID=3821 RepID=A0A151R3F5_CAJCA|nr:carboxylesterase 1 [Cajanus cajan]KYP37053.1 Gibberellin receptor GID1 [Cajanus cajan]
MSRYAFPRSEHFGVTIIAFSFYLFLSVVNSSVVDTYKQIHVTLARQEKTSQSPTIFKDITINQSKSTSARVYVSREALDNPRLKLPVVFFYHGGGFVAFSPSSPDDHKFCLQMASDTQSVVVSIDYRLAPVHRLPAAYEDAMEALHWITTTSEAFVTSHVDYSRCFLMGWSAGGNIAYNAGLRAAAEVDQIKPVVIQGLILIHPFFGGVKRTPSELRLAHNLELPLFATDLAWKLSLPIGANRDHEFSNPTVHGGSPALEQIRGLGWRVVVFGCDGDLLVDRQVGFTKLVEEKGVHVVGQFFRGGYHGIFIQDPSMAKKVYHQLQISMTAS